MPFTVMVYLFIVVFSLRKYFHSEESKAENALAPCPKLNSESVGASGGRIYALTECRSPHLSPARAPCL